MSIDLHVHSVNSDGTESTEAIIESSIELQLEAICISDHEYLTKVPTKQYRNNPRCRNKCKLGSS